VLGREAGLSGERVPALELALGVVGQEAVGVVDHPREAAIHHLLQGLFDRRLGPAAAARVVQPAASHQSEVRRQAFGDSRAQRVGGGQTGVNRRGRVEHCAVGRQQQCHVTSAPRSVAAGMLEHVRGREVCQHVAGERVEHAHAAGRG